MQQTIKTCRRVGALICLGAALMLGGCNGCNSNNGNNTGSDTTAKKDSAMVMKKDSDSTAVKKSATDTTANPPSHLPKKDTAVKARPIVRKT